MYHYILPPAAAPNARSQLKCDHACWVVPKSTFIMKNVSENQSEKTSDVIILTFYSAFKSIRMNGPNVWIHFTSLLPLYYNLAKKNRGKLVL